MCRGVDFCQTSFRDLCVKCHSVADVVALLQVSSLLSVFGTPWFAFVYDERLRGGGGVAGTGRVIGMWHI